VPSELSLPNPSDTEIARRAAELLNPSRSDAEMWGQDQAGRIVWHTDGLAHLLGEPGEAYLEHVDRLVELVHPSDRKLFTETTAGLHRPGIWRLVHPAGAETGRWLRTIVAGRRCTSDGAAVVASIEDVTSQIDEMVAVHRLSLLATSTADAVAVADDADFDAAIEAALGSVGAHLDAVGIGLVSLLPDGRVAHLHLWAKDRPTGPPPLVAAAGAAWLRSALDGPTVVGIDTVDLGSPLLTEAARRGARSLIRTAVPRPEGEVGFVVVASQRPAERWHGVTLDVLNGFARGLHAGVARQADRRRQRDALLAVDAAREEAEAANVEKDQILSRASHELRTPISILVTSAELLALEQPPLAKNEHLRRITAAAHEQLAVVDDLLAAARLSGSDGVEATQLDVVALVDRQLNQVRPLADARGIQLHLTSTDASVGLFAHPDLVTRVVSNLVSNAVKYNRERGTVTVDITQMDRGARLAIRDTGPGIPAADRHRLWEPFERLDADRTAVPGTGLGLSIVHQALDRLGGTIELDSSPAGSTFTVTLPDAGTKLPSPVGSVLIVDDNEPWRTVLAARLIRVSDIPAPRMAGSAAEAIAEVTADPPAVVLLDRHLPDADGEDLIQTLRDLPGAANLRVVIVSADATDRARQRCLDAGADAYFVKPPALDELGELIRTMSHSPIAQPDNDTSPGGLEEPRR
jgi:signal transduction histidine kinase/ActR/RegA family two-component response regulator